MRSNVAVPFVIVIISVSFCVLVAAGLKCQTDDGPTEEDVKRVVRVCMKKIGESFDEDSNDYDDDDQQDSDQDNYRSRNRDHLRGRQGRYRRSNYRNTDRGGGGGGNRYSGYGQNQNQSQSNYDRRSEYDRSCLIHCFFQEMKMTNEDELPDKHKVLHVLTKELRDRQLKDFYTDSIQECFHILEMDQRREKCDFSRNLIFCLGERAKANCDDWNDTTVLF